MVSELDQTSVSETVEMRTVWRLLQCSDACASGIVHCLTPQMSHLI